MKTTSLLGILLLGAGGLPAHAQDCPTGVRDPSTRRVPVTNVRTRYQTVRGSTGPEHQALRPRFDLARFPGG